MVSGYVVARLALLLPGSPGFCLLRADERSLESPSADAVAGSRLGEVPAAPRGSEEGVCMAATTLAGGTFALAGDLMVTRIGYGAMQLAGPHVFGPPADRDAAVAVLREAVELGITHIDTADFYGPHVTNQ